MHTLCKKSWLSADFKSWSLVLGKLSLNHGNLVQEAEMYSVKGLGPLTANGFWPCVAQRRSESPGFSSPASVPVFVSELAAEWAAGQGSRDSKETSVRARLGGLPRLPHSKGGWAYIHSLTGSCLPWSRPGGPPGEKFHSVPPPWWSQCRGWPESGTSNTRTRKDTSCIWPVPLLAWPVWKDKRKETRRRVSQLKQGSKTLRYHMLVIAS